MSRRSLRKITSGQAGMFIYSNRTLPKLCLSPIGGGSVVSVVSVGSGRRAS